MSTCWLIKLALPALVIVTLACNASALGTSRPPTAPPLTAGPRATAGSLPPGTAAPSATAASLALATLAPKPISQPTPVSNATPAPAGGGHITYRLGNAVYRLAASAGATPQNVSAALNALAAGNDSWLNTSPDGAWLLLGTERFDPACAGWACLALVPADLSAGSVIHSGGQPIHPDGFSAVAAGGQLVVYPASGGPHTQDLWAVSQTNGQWGAPVLLSAGSPFADNAQPALSAGGDRVLFDCGDQPYAAAGTAICEVRVDGTGFRTVLAPAQAPPGLPTTGALHHAAYAPDSGVIFEGNWGVEQIWRLAAGAAPPALIAAQYTNDNSPCMLPDGRVVSLWLGRAGNPAGLHELKIMSPDGGNALMPLNGQDVTDIGIGCGE